MRLLICCVYDAAAAAFMQPFFVRSKGEAIRSFMDACSDGKTNFCRHPQDFTLFQIGMFDDTDAGIVSAVAEKLITAQECVAQVDVVEDNAGIIRDMKRQGAGKLSNDMNGV